MQKEKYCEHCNSFLTVEKEHYVIAKPFRVIEVYFKEKRIYYKISSLFAKEKSFLGFYEFEANKNGSCVFTSKELAQAECDRRNANND